MPIGLENAGSKFHRMMYKVLDGFIFEISYVYIDDIINFSEDIECYEDNVKSV